MRRSVALCTLAALVHMQTAALADPPAGDAVPDPVAAGPVSTPRPDLADPLDVGKALVRCTGKLQECRIRTSTLSSDVDRLRLDVAAQVAEKEALERDLLVCENDCQARLRAAEESQGYSLVAVILVGLGAAALGAGIGIGVGATFASR